MDVKVLFHWLLQWHPPPHWLIQAAGSPDWLIQDGHLLKIGHFFSLKSSSLRCRKSRVKLLGELQDRLLLWLQQMMLAPCSILKRSRKFGLVILLFSITILIMRLLLLGKTLAKKMLTLLTCSNFQNINVIPI